jgi:hypothetical protein
MQKGWKRSGFRKRKKGLTVNIKKQAEVIVIGSPAIEGKDAKKIKAIADRLKTRRSPSEDFFNINPACF